MAGIITENEKKTLSVLAFLLFRMGMQERAGRVYEAIAELSEVGSADYRFAQAGVASVAVELGDGAKALSAVREAIKGAPVSSAEAALYLIQAQALWLQGRKEEASASRDEFLYLSGNPGEGES